MTRLCIHLETGATHRFYVYVYVGADGTHRVEYRPLNPRTGQPWQASRRVEIGADATPPGWDRPIAYSTLDRALAAIAAQRAKLNRRSK